MAWDLSADREREQVESLRNAWLEREEVILNHLRVSAAMFRWGYRILGIIAALVAAIMLAVGLIDVDFREFFWLFVPLSLLFALIGAPLGAAGVVYARSAWAVRKR